MLIDSCYVIDVDGCRDGKGILQGMDERGGAEDGDWWEEGSEEEGERMSSV